VTLAFEKSVHPHQFGWLILSCGMFSILTFKVIEKFFMMYMGC